MTDKELLIDIQKQIDAHFEGGIEIPVTDIQVSFVHSTRVQLTWKAHADGEMDIRYYLKGKEEWKHSFHKYKKKYINIKDEKADIGFSTEFDEAYFKIVIGDWESETVTLKKKDKPELSPFHLIKKYTGKPAQGDPYLGWLYSVVKHNSKLRILYEVKTVPKTMDSYVLIETSDPDLKQWKYLGSPKVTNKFAEHHGLQGFIYHNGWKGWGTAKKDGKTGMYLYESEDGLEWKAIKLAFDNWALDTKFNMIYDPNRDRYLMYGRVRGSQSNFSGGFGDDLNRRGISYHRSKTPDWKGEWTNGEVIVDPMDLFDYNAKSPLPAPDSIIDTEGKKRVGHGLIRYDFYAPNAFWDGEQYRAFAVTFFRNGNRIIDRGGTTPFSDRDSVDQRRWRYTGAWYPIELISADGKKWTIKDKTYGSALGVGEPFKRMIPKPPYVWTGSDSQVRMSDEAEIPMIDMWGGVVKWHGKKYVFFNQIDRFYFQVGKNDTLNGGLYAKEIS